MVTPPPASEHPPPSLVAVPSRTAVGQVRLLLRLSELLAVSRTLDEVSSAIMQIATEFLGASFGGIAVIDPDRVLMRYHDLQHLAEPVRTNRRVFALTSSAPAAVAARENRMLLIDEVSGSPHLDAVTQEAVRLVDGKAVAYLPMQLAHRSIGTIALMWTSERTFVDRDVALFSGLARYAAHAVDRALLLADRQQVATVLQEALLPRLPDVDWLSLTASYRVARHGDEVGGDWYDAFAVPTSAHGEQVLAVVGDVSGHDTYAAAYMGRIQAKLRALALDHPDDPHRLLERLERVMDVTADHRLVTGIVAGLTRATADDPAMLRWSNAGHPAPLLIEPGRPARFLDPPVQRLLGLSRKPARRTDTMPLAPGSTLLMYTDGLVERRDDTISNGLDRLLDTVNRHRTEPIEALVELLATQMANADDDSVVFAATLRD